jgi:hypothetical protein
MDLGAIHSYTPQTQGIVHVFFLEELTLLLVTPKTLQNPTSIGAYARIYLLLKSLYHPNKILQTYQCTVVTIVPLVA